MAPCTNGDGDMGDKQTISIVVMGVAGTGKTTLAEELAKRLKWPYAEADDFHPKANIEKMAAGHPLTDEDRWPWLQALRDWISGQSAQGNCTLVTCSALKRVYRDVLRQAKSRVVFVELDLDKDDLRKRMTQRDHFMPISLLDSQLQTLEPLESDEDGFRLLSSPAPEVLADTVMERLSLKAS